jgi:hypothetical protein
MAEAKTKATKVSVKDFLASVEDDSRRKDAQAVEKIFRDVTGEKSVMWGANIVGYGAYDGPTGRWMRLGFSPRKTNLVLDVLLTGAGQEAALVKLGKHKTGKGCLYLTKLADVDEKALRDVIKRGWDFMAKKFPA